jgi:AraC-like DNA-binding protein
MKSFASVFINALNHHDGVTVKHASFCNKAFPFHFHNEWSIGLVSEGSEVFKSTLLSFNMSKNTLILIPPRSIHANEGLGNAPWKYSTFYLSEATMQWHLKRLQLDYERAVNIPYFISSDSSSIKLFKRLIVTSTHAAVFSEQLMLLLSCLLNKDALLNPLHAKKESESISELIHYLHQNHRQKVSLDAMSLLFGYNKFKLLRLFKSSTGLNPIEYQLSLRIEHCKHQLLRGDTLQDTCFSSGFYDLSHFSNTFKRFTGLSPSAYKKSCNILQVETILGV